ncbi:hypothetical protein GQ457_14G020400 [Hibiscus cannabinus]
MSRKLEALVYYDGEMLSDPSFGVVFQANNTVTFKISRRSTFEVLTAIVCKKAPNSRGRQLQSLQYRLPTSLEPLTYSVFHVGDDGDVLMMLETHCQYSFGGPIELLATFSDEQAGCSNQVPNWGRVNFDFDPNAQSPTAGLRRDFNLLNTSYEEGGSSSHSAHRHSCVASFGFDLNMPPTQESTYNPYTAEAGRSSSYHEARSPYDHERFNPFDDFSSGRLFSHPSSPSRFPFHFHPNDKNSISSSISSCFGLSMSDCKNFIQVKRIHSRRRRRPFQIFAVFERFTERAIKSVIISQREAKSLGNDMVFTQHLLLGLIGEDRDPNGFLGSGLNFDEVREAVCSIWQNSNRDGSGKQEGSSVPTTDVPFSASTKRVFEAAVEYSRNMGYNFISPEHIAIGLFTVDDGSAEKVLKRLGANVDLLTAAAVTRLQGELAKDGREPPLSSKKMPEKSLSGNGAVLRSPKKAKGESPLDQFCVDLTARASEGLIDPVIGRENEVQRTVQILCRKSKNNPILLGESGVSKTAIAEGLAIRLAQNKRILSLDIGLLMAGAKERGELEARVTALLNETIKSGDVILFIDEVHTLVGSGTVGRGNKGSGLDISNLLKPALGRGELQKISSVRKNLSNIQLMTFCSTSITHKRWRIFIGFTKEKDKVEDLTHHLD